MVQKVIFRRLVSINKQYLPNNLSLNIDLVIKSKHPVQSIKLFLLWRLRIFVILTVDCGNYVAYLLWHVYYVKFYMWHIYWFIKCCSRLLSMSLFIWCLTIITRSLMIDNGAHLTGNSYHYNENWRSDKQYFDLG